MEPFIMTRNVESGTCTGRSNSKRRRRFGYGFGYGYGFGLTTATNSKQDKRHAAPAAAAAAATFTKVPASFVSGVLVSLLLMGCTSVCINSLSLLGVHAQSAPTPTPTPTPTMTSLSSSNSPLPQFQSPAMIPVPNFLAGSNNSNNNDENNNNSNSNSNIGDVLCTMDDLERANDSQLNIIFRELQQSNFFRHFVVDLEIKCRHQLKKPTNDKNEKEKEKESDNKKESDNAATKKPTKTSSSSSSSSSFSSQSQSQSFSSSSPLSFLGGSSPGGSDNDGDGDGDDFQCSGGADELDEDATPLCSVDAGESFDEKTNDLFSSSSSSSSSPTSPLAPSSSASASSSWEDQTTDKIVRDPDDPPCDEDDENGVFDIPDSFWMDMCSNIHKGEGTKIVNLSLNPERNTYYNGTHIWKAIYDENCITTNDSCLEERVLYRLLSGMHTSTTLSIARNYYPPSKRTGRTDWEANPQYFMERFQDHPEHIRNLHFSYVVLLRAIKKASAYLYDYDVSSGVPVEDASTAILLRRLLDTTILRSCSGVFSAFDETVMFRDNNNNNNSNSNSNNLLLRESFKGVFHNISSILDCVQCQQCKLHGKLTMLGYGTALKILFVKSPKNLVLERNEVVALVNTAARLSENLVEVRELTALYWEQERKRVADLEANTETGRGGPAKSVVYDSDDPSFSSPTSSSSFAATAAALAAAAGPPYDSLDVLDLTVGVISAARRDDLLSVERETELIQMALVKRHPELMILGKHYHNDPERFATLSESLGADSSSSSTTTTTKALLPVRPPDAIVVGSGLAGLAASLNILDRGGTVVILEKEHLVGGNSNKASSGINGYCPNNSNNANANANATTCFDSIETFRNDTIRSAGAEADVDLINVLVTKSSQAVSWLRDRADVDLSLLAQLGGHSTKRTHRPSNGMAGAEIVYHMQKAVRSFEKTGRVKILVDTKVKELLTEEQHGGDGNGGRVIGVRAESTTDGTSQTITILADNVILATGGFASDRSSGSYLDQYRPELMSFPATAGGFSTGDGIALATTLGAATRDMDKVQIHPTGWVDPKDPTNPTKILAAELMRGVGGILIDSSGKRFANELGTRAYVTDRMLKHDKEFVKTGKWNPSSDVPTFFLVLSSSAAADGKKHVDLYTHKGLLTKVEGIDALSKHTKLDQRTLTKTMRGYQSAAKKGSDEFGKTSFRGVPSDNLTKETFYVGEVTPVLHYCMGGIKINPECSVIREDGRVIEGLHAAGEVTGGVHGANRLGGNSLLECTVFGTVVGQKVPVKEGAYRIVVGDEEISTGTEQSDPDAKASNELPDIRMEELAKHNTKEDLWVAIHGVVYDFTEFAEEHPAGFKSIFDLAGTDGTAAFDAVHNVGMLDDFEQDKRGVLV